MNWKEFKKIREIELGCLIKSKTTQYGREYMYWRRKYDPEFRKSQCDISRPLIQRWRKNNPTKVIGYIKKSKSRPEFRACEACRKFVKRFLFGRAKSEETFSVIGCSRDYLLNHLSGQFSDGMNWGNYGRGPGRWNIDHRIPLASAKGCQKTLNLLNHFSNLQPMWHEDNLKKGCRIWE